MTPRIIDTCTYVGHFPFRKLPCEELAQVAALAEKNGITHLVLSNLNSIFYIDPMEGNRELIDMCAAYGGAVSVLPFAVLDPTYIEWERDLRECRSLGFVGVQLMPQYHGYEPTAATELVELCGELGMVVRLDTGIEDIRQRAKCDVKVNLSPDSIAELVERCSKTSMLIGMLTGAPSGRLAEVMNFRDNVLAGITYFDSFNQGQLERALGSVGSKRLCFATQSPLRYIEPQLVKLMLSDGMDFVLDDEARADILWRNAASLLL